jgi:hypothetical protein
MSQLVKTKRQANFKDFKRFGAFKKLVEQKNVIFTKFKHVFRILSRNLFQEKRKKKSPKKRTLQRLSCIIINYYLYIGVVTRITNPKKLNDVIVTCSYCFINSFSSLFYYFSKILKMNNSCLV